MTCKDCLHSEVCHVIKITCGFKENAETLCKNFKNNADYAEVKHGYWTEKYIPLAWCDDDVDIVYECSICKSEEPYTSTYCPNCSAKNDKKEGAEK